MPIPENLNLNPAIDAAEKKCAMYGERVVGTGEVELSMDDLDMVADAVKGAAPATAAAALRHATETIRNDPGRAAWLKDLGFIVALNAIDSIAADMEREP